MVSHVVAIFQAGGAQDIVSLSLLVGHISVYNDLLLGNNLNDILTPNTKQFQRTHLNNVAR